MTRRALLTLTLLASLSSYALGTGGEQQTAREQPPVIVLEEKDPAPPSQTNWPAIIAAIGAIVTPVAIEWIKSKRAPKTTDE